MRTRATQDAALEWRSNFQLASSVFLKFDPAKFVV